VCINLKKRVYGYHGYQRIFFRNRGLKIQLILKRNDALAYITLQRPYRYAYHSALCIGWTRKLRKVSLHGYHGYHGYQRIFFRNRGLKIQLILKRNDALAYITLQRPYRYAYHSALCIGWTRKLRKVSLGTSEFF